MAKTKAELESDRDRYQNALNSAIQAEQRENYESVLVHALSSLPYIEGMLQHLRRYEKRQEDVVLCIELIAKYAPVLFHAQSINELEVFMKNKKRIFSKMKTDPVELILSAREVMQKSYLLWDYIDNMNNNVDISRIPKALGGRKKEWDKIISLWLKIGILRIASNGHENVSLVTRLYDPISAKCPSCGAVAKARKVKFLKEQQCPRCKSEEMFVIIANNHC